MPRFGNVDRAAANHRLFDKADLERATAELETRSGDSKTTLEQTYTSLRNLGPWRPLARAPAQLEISRLRHDFANFGEVIDFVEAQNALSNLGRSRIAYFPPLLLISDPGLGKTAFASRLAGVLGTSFAEISLPGATASFTIAGLSSGWAGGKAGRIFQGLAWNGPSNPVILLDELDKASGSYQYDVGDVLLGLLEKHSAARFIDEYIEFPIDCSRVMWVATANSVAEISSPLLSRFQIFHIDAPDHEQGRRIAQSVYTSLRASSDWGAFFPEQLPDSVATLLSAHSPRAQQQQLLQAMGLAARDGRSIINPGDLKHAPGRVTRIGF